VSSPLHALRGPAITFVADPFLVGRSALHHVVDAMLVMEGGMIRAFGEYAVLRSQFAADLPVTHYPDDLILPGFVDLHVHYPQVSIIGSHGKQLIDWLNQYAFPAEMAFADAAHAAAAAEFFLDECLRAGTTTAMVYGTVHKQSAESFFAAAERRGMRMITGKVMMDRNAPAALCDTARQSYDDSKALIEKWHGRGRLEYAVTPRFAVTSTPEQLEAAAALRREHPDVLMQTHIAENLDEIAAVTKLFPERRDYFDVYAHHQLAGPRSVFGHAIHLHEREWQAAFDTGSALAHCPTSNGFLGSGLFPMQKAKQPGRHIPVGIASDVGGGTSLSLLRTLSCAYMVGQLSGRTLTAAEALYSITRGAAAALGLEQRIGSLAAGFEADVVVLNPRSTAMLAQRTERCENIDELLFAQIIMADDRATRAVYIGGKLSFSQATG